MSLPQISVIIPVYNTGALAAKLIDFLLAGSYDNLEIIAVDDGSADDSLKILKSIKSPKLKVYHQKNSGAASARNLGLKKAAGDLISFIDSDDFIKRSFLPRLASALADKNATLAMTGVEYHRVADGSTFPAYPSPQPEKRPGESFKAYVLRLMSIDGRLYSVTNKLFRADVIRARRLAFDTKLDFAEDTKFVLDYLAAAPGKIVWIPDNLFIYNYGTATSTVASSSLDWQNWQKSYDYLKVWLGPRPSKRESLNLKKVLFRWQVSHKLAVARANISTKEKLTYINLPQLIFARISILFRR